MELIEEGRADSPETEALLTSILAPWRGKLNALVLGCTHYPFVKKTVARILGEHTELLDGSLGTARETKRRLEKAGLLEMGAGEVEILNSSGDPNMIRMSWERLKQV